MFTVPSAPRPGSRHVAACPRLRPFAQSMLLATTVPVVTQNSRRAFVAARFLVVSSSIVPRTHHLPRFLHPK